MKTKLFDNGKITIAWGRDGIDIRDTYNSFNVYIAKDMAKYFIYLTEVLYKICKSMGSAYISFHGRINHDGPSEYITQRILSQFRDKGYISGNYMDIDRKDLILSCFKKCFRIKQDKLDLKDIELNDMPITALIYIKKGLL